MDNDSKKSKSNDLAQKIKDWGKAAFQWLKALNIFTGVDWTEVRSWVVWLWDWFSDWFIY